MAHWPVRCVLKGEMVRLDCTTGKKFKAFGERYGVYEFGVFNKILLETSSCSFSIFFDDGKEFV